MSSASRRTCTNRRPARRDSRTQVTCVVGEVYRARTASRLTRAAGLVLKLVPRKAFKAATDPFTYTVADPSSDTYTSSSYSYWRKRLEPPHAALASAIAISTSPEMRITANDIVKISPALMTGKPIVYLIDGSSQ